ncbi:hypothetical protein Tco_1297961 [Tanacetum coccineum]
MIQLTPHGEQTHCKHTAEDDLEVFSTDDLSLDWNSAHNFLTRLQKLSLYASGHLEVSELAACLEKASFSNTSGHDEYLVEFYTLPTSRLLFLTPSQTDIPETDKN